MTSVYQYNIYLISHLWGLDNVMFLQFINEGGIVGTVAPPGHLRGGGSGELTHQQSEAGDVGPSCQCPPLITQDHLQALAVPLQHLPAVSIMSCVKSQMCSWSRQTVRLANMEGRDGARGRAAITISGKSSLVESCPSDSM